MGEQLIALELREPAAIAARGMRDQAVLSGGTWGKPNGRAPAKKATTGQRVSAGIAARLAERGAYLSGFGFAYGQN
jgi:hypothetical protein